MSFLSRLFNVIRRPLAGTGFVGRDLEGNRFFEQLEYGRSRPKRTVKYRGNDYGPYIGGGKRLPIQWTAWLAHTRTHPPTIEELQADVLRQQRVQANAALLEARENEARLSVTAPPVEPEAVSTADQPSSAHPNVTRPEPSQTPQKTQDTPSSPFPDLPKHAFEPEPWSPQVGPRRRGKG